jgi:undecaprenyl-diphosphatase
MTDGSTGYWETILLGIVQGIAEFLPISSSGHLVILESLLGGELESLELNVALHFGTLMSILVVYRKDLIPILQQPRLMTAIIVATLPVVVTGLGFKQVFEWAASAPLYAGFGLLVTTALLFLTPKIDSGTRDLHEIRLRDALVIGLFQAIAPWPGISRSGSTIVGALLMGVRREAAANFSFYIAIPALLGASVLVLKDLFDGAERSTPFPAMLAGTVIAFLVGIVALRVLLKIVAARRLVWFGWYTLTVAILTIAASLGRFV